MKLNTNGNYNTCVGDSAMIKTTVSSNNTVIGYNAMNNYTDSTYGGNTVIGYNSSQFVNNGNNSVVIGSNALATTLSSFSDVIIGSNSVKSVTTTSTGNTIIGYNAGSLLISSTNNIILGSNAQARTTNASYNLVIGDTDFQNNNILSYGTGTYYLQLTVGTTGFNVPLSYKGVAGFTGNMYVNGFVNSNTGAIYTNTLSTSITAPIYSQPSVSTGLVGNFPYMYGQCQEIVYSLIGSQTNNSTLDSGWTSGPMAYTVFSVTPAAIYGFSANANFPNNWLQYQYTPTLPQGNYMIEYQILFASDAGVGSIQVSYDNGNDFITIRKIDMYKNTSLFTQMRDFVAVPSTNSGMIVRWLSTGKNASSSAYQFGLCNYFRITRLG